MIRLLAVAVLLLLSLSGEPSPAQECPKGSLNCPFPQARAQAPERPFVFRVESGNPAPWATAVRITASRANNEQSLGSGTIIDSSVNSSLVMTCAHVLRGKPSLTVEIFGQRMNGRTGSVGPAIARFPAVEVDRNDASDVGLVRFTADRPLPSSKLVPLGWSPSSEPLCSVGCSRGADPTAVTEQAIRPVKFQFGLKTYHGLECEKEAIEGRSGGGLFDQDGRLAGVCDLNETNEKHGVYASTESLRAILRANGLVEMADGVTRRPPAGPVVSTPAPTAAPDSPDLITINPGAVAKIEQEATSLLMPLIAGAGVGGFGLLGGALAFFARRKPVPTGPLTAFSPTPEDLTRLLVISLKQREENEAQSKSNAALLEQIKSLVSTPQPPAAPNA